MRLSPKQARFVDEYLVDLNATQAAIRAGYAPTNADVVGPRLVGKSWIAEAIQAGIKQRSLRTNITQDRVLQELGRIAFFDIRKIYRDDGSLKAPSELDDESAAVLAGIDVVEMAGGMKIEGDGAMQHVPMYTKKAKIPDKVAALALAMRHLGMLTEKVEHSGSVEVRRFIVRG